LEKHDVPFRLTRNITEFIGPFLLEGVLIPSFVIISSALHAKQKLLEPVLHLLLRDDVMAWYISKSSAKNDQKMQEVERQLSDRIWSNVHFVQDRFEECSPRVVEDAAAEAIKPNPDPIDIKVRSLINAATSAEKLSLMPPAYQPWL
jgi:transformation/transcription domain-associated protein